MKFREQLQDILNNIAQELAIEDIDEGRSEIDTVNEFVQELFIMYDQIFKDAFYCYQKVYEDRLEYNEFDKQ